LQHTTPYVLQRAAGQFKYQQAPRRIWAATLAGVKKKHTELQKSFLVREMSAAFRVGRFMQRSRGFWLALGCGTTSGRLLNAGSVPNHDWGSLRLFHGLEFVANVHPASGRELVQVESF